MSLLEVNENSGKVKDVFFAFVRLRKPVKKYQSENTEYTVSFVTDKTTAKALKKVFTKVSLKEVENEDFETVYKFAPPFPEQEEQYVFSFRSDSHYKDGTEKEYKFTTRPKAYIPCENGVKDVTMDINIGNGSFGDVAFNINTRETGKFAGLIGVLITNLAELEQREYHNPFGEVVTTEQEELEESPF